MIALSILGIIKVAGEILLEVIKTMPEADRQAFLDRHNARMERYERLLDVFKPKAEDETPETPVTPTP